MFHIPNDKRSKNSAAVIATELTRLIAKIEFDQITIADLQKRTGIARTTFYRNFDNLIDVLEWQCDHQFNQLFKNFSDLDHFPSEKVALQIYLEFGTKHYQILENLIKIQRIDIIYKYQKKYAESMASEYGSLKDIAPIEQKYFLNVRIGFILSIILTWIENGRRESLLQLQAIAQHQLEYLMNTFE